MTGGFNKNMKFLMGGGVMGQLIERYDWSTSSLGVPESWPSSLTHSISNMLRTGFPMLVLWGKQFICFYNDAFVPSLGREQHPSIGKPAKEVWSDGWEFIGTMLNGVLKTGQAVTFSDQPVIILRNGLTENAYFTFCYSQILDDHGEAGGVLVTCVETTGIVTANKKLAEREKNLNNIILQAPFPICIFRGADFIVEAANESMLEFWDKSADDIIGKPLFDAVPETRSQGYEQSLNNVLNFGEPFSVAELPVSITRKGSLITAYINFTFQPLRDDDGSISGILATAADVTEQVNARQKRIYETIIGSIDDLAYVFDLQYRFTYANDALLSMWGKSREDAVGKGLRENGYEEWHALMHEREIDQVAATKKSIRGEVSFPHATLGRRVYDYILVPVFNEEGEVEAVAGTTRDISDITSRIKHHGK